MDLKTDKHTLHFKHGFLQMWKFLKGQSFYIKILKFNCAGQANLLMWVWFHYHVYQFVPPEASVLSKLTWWSCYIWFFIVSKRECVSPSQDELWECVFVLFCIVCTHASQSMGILHSLFFFFFPHKECFTFISLVFVSLQNVTSCCLTMLLLYNDD